MITRVRVRSWRNYEDLELDLKPGTTFLVAANGVGKTSFVEAVSWALFGLANGGVSPSDAVRAGSSEASVEVTMTLGSHGLLHIRRALPRRPVRVSEATASLNGNVITTDDLAALLSETFEANYAFLARLLIPLDKREQATTKPDQIGLEQHLGRIYGVDNLQAALSDLDQRIKGTERPSSRRRPAKPRTRMPSRTCATSSAPQPPAVKVFKKTWLNSKPRPTKRG